MISLADSQPLKTNLFSSTTGVLQKDISVTKSMPVWLKTALRDGTSFRRLKSSIGLNNLHQLPNFVLNIDTLTCNVKAQKLICKSIFFTNIILSRKLKCKQTFAIACSFILNKLRATDSSISPGLINKVDSIYISVQWFRFTLMEPAIRVLFHRFQTIFDRIKDWPFLSRFELNQQMQSNTTLIITSQSLGDRVRGFTKWTRKQSPEFDKKAHQTRREGQTRQGSTPGREANGKLDSS